MDGLTKFDKHTGEQKDLSQEHLDNVSFQKQSADTVQNSVNEPKRIQHTEPIGGDNVGSMLRKR